MGAVAIDGAQGQRCLIDSYLLRRAFVVEVVVGPVREKGRVEYVQGVSELNQREVRGKGESTSILLLCCK